MIFEVDIVKTTVKKVKVNATSLAEAKVAAKELDQSGIFADIKGKIVGKEYDAWYRCDRCGRSVHLFYGAGDESFCIPCYKKLCEGWKAKKIS